MRSLQPRTSLRADVEEAVSTAIVVGELAAGSVVSVPDLAARFGVSATPVREAMLNLEQRGMVTSVRNKGFRVTAMDADDLRQVVQIRTWLEVPAIRLAAAAFPTERLEQFRSAADAIVAAGDGGDLAGWLIADTAFHLALTELVGNPRLTTTVADLRHQTRLVGLAGMRDRAELRRSADEHHALLDLVADGNGDGAAELLTRHIGHVLGWWSGMHEGVAAEGAVAEDSDGSGNDTRDDDAVGVDGSMV